MLWFSMNTQFTVSGEFYHVNFKTILFDQLSTGNKCEHFKYYTVR